MSNQIPYASLKYDRGVAEQVNADITREIYKAGKIPNIPVVRKVIKGLLDKPVSNFSAFIARLDALIGQYGFPFAADRAIQELAGGMRAVGALEIPQKGPLIIASNHPGTYDGFVIISKLIRTDFKLMVSGIPFFKNLPHASKHLIFTSYDTTGQMLAVRHAVRHLESGGLLLIFPSGRIDPDPAVLPGADKSLSLWSRSIELFMRKVPEAELVLAITSGVLSREFVRHPYPRLYRNDHERRRVMEFMQVIKQMVRGKPVDINPAVSFAKFNKDALKSGRDQGILRDSIHTQARQLLAMHISNFYAEI